MDLKKIVPWNWFKNEDEEASTKPVRIDRPVDPVIGDFPPFHQLQRQMERLFDDFSRDFGRHGWPLGDTAQLMRSGFLKPSINVGGNEKEYSISVEIPGVDEKDVKVELRDNTLTISGEKRQEKEDKQKDFYRIERSYGSFRRVLTLPDDADQNGIKATFRKGVLQLTIPKTEVAATEVKKIDITPGD